MKLSVEIGVFRNLGVKWNSYRFEMRVIIKYSLIRGKKHWKFYVIPIMYKHGNPYRKPKKVIYRLIQTKTLSKNCRRLIFNHQSFRMKNIKMGKSRKGK